MISETCANYDIKAPNIKLRKLWVVEDVCVKKIFLISQQQHARGSEKKKKVLTQSRERWEICIIFNISFQNTPANKLYIIRRPANLLRRFFYIPFSTTREKPVGIAICSHLTYSKVVFNTSAHKREIYIFFRINFHHLSCSWSIALYPKWHFWDLFSLELKVELYFWENWAWKYVRKFFKNYFCEFWRGFDWNFLEYQFKFFITVFWETFFSNSTQFFKNINLNFL